MKYGREVNLSQVVFQSGEQKDFAALFRCSNKALDKYLLESLSEKDSVTYIFIDEDTKKIAGYASLVCSLLTITDDEVTEKYPSVEIKAFAVDEKYQNMPFSENREDGVLSDKILNNMVSQIYDIVESVIGADYILLYSVENAQDFYERNGFKKFGETMQEHYNYFNESCIPMYYKL